MHTDTPLPRKEGSNLVSEGEERKKGKKARTKGDEIGEGLFPGR